MPQRDPVGCRMVCPAAPALCLERDIERPMKPMVNIPRLTDHRHDARGRPAEAGQKEAVVTGRRDMRVGGTHRCADHHGAAKRPLR